MSIFQYRHRLDNALWPFWMSGSGVINAALIVKNDHRKNWELTGTTLYRHGDCCIFKHSIHRKLNETLPFKNCCRDFVGLCRGHWTASWAERGRRGRRRDIRSPRTLHGRGQRLCHIVLRSVSATDTNAVTTSKWRQLPSSTEHCAGADKL